MPQTKSRKEASNERRRKSLLKYYRIHGGMDKRRRENISKARKRYFRKNPIARELLRQLRIEFYKNPAERKRTAEASKRVYRERPEVKHKISISLMKYWDRNPEAKIRMSRIKIRQYKTNPALKKKIDKIITDWWKEHPNIKKARAEKLKKFYTNNPDALKEFLSHSKNSIKPHLKTSQGFLVRSRGEKIISNFIYNHNIPCLYESISLPITTNPYKGNICTPDFYIPSLNIFIEFYGGHPQAWKKKVLKNKLYKAHKIPVLAITPAELENLDYFLRKQGAQLSESKVAREFRVLKWVRD